MKAKVLNNTYLIYSITFLLLLPMIFLPFLKEGRTFVWYVDGMNQHYPILLYYGELLRGLLLGRGFPMVDFSIGMGFDTITTLHYYVLGDPISLLSIFMTQENGPVFYTILILLRLYLIGISFLVFCRYWGRKGNGAALGALLYVFCGFTFFSGVRHPYFLNPMIYLPLLLIGLEQVLRRRKPQLLILMAFICTVSNFYFLYIITVMAVIYVILRYTGIFHTEEKNKLVGFLKAGLRTGGCYLLGVVMAAVIFLPVIYAFLQNGRMDSKPELLTGYLHYNKAYYLYALQGLFASGVGPSYWVDLTFSSVTGISVAIVLSNRKYRKLAVVFVLTFLALFVPAFGYFMNAFSYITNRWDFLVSFVVAVVFTFTYEKLFLLELREKVLLGMGITGYGLLAFVLPSVPIVKYTFFLLLFTTAVILLLQTYQSYHIRKLQSATLYLLIVGTLAFNGFAFYSSSFHGYAKQFLTTARIRELTEGGEAELVSELEEGSYRIETFGEGVRNESLIHGFHDVSSYFSLMDGNVTDYYKQLEMISQRSAYRIDNQDSRTIPDALAGVKYFISTNQYASPYAYELRKEKTYGSKTYYLLENLLALPLGYTYRNYMTEEEYLKLSALEKQNALLYAVVLENETDYVTSTRQDMSIGIEKLEYELDTDESIKIKKDGFQVLREDAVMRLTFDNKKKAETYVRFPKLSINKRAMLMRTFKVKGEREVTKKVNIRNIYHNSYFGKVNFLINTGYSKIEKNWVKITFPEKGNYDCEQIEVYSLSMEHVKKQLNKLRQDTLYNIKERNDRIEGDASLSSQGIMVLSIPYSKGWSAVVDGKKVELKKANIMYCALELQEGEHHIVLTYRTPYLLTGLLLSLGGLILFVGIGLYLHRKEVHHV